jgi:hypothetical protein
MSGSPPARYILRRFLPTAKSAERQTMSPESVRAPLDHEIRFDAAAEPAAAAPACGNCSRPITESYHEANGVVVCPECRTALEAAATGGSSSKRLARAALYGFGAAVAGAGLYYAIVALTGYEIGLVAIAVGWMVGRAVQVGSDTRGGRGYQALAVALTYLAIVSTYVPYFIEGFTDAATAATATAVDSAPAVANSAVVEAAEPADAAGFGAIVVGVGALLLLAIAAPFLAGIENAIGILIIGFALYQAWKMNARAPLVFTGPYALGTPRPAADA